MANIVVKSEYVIQFQHSCSGDHVQFVVHASKLLVESLSTINVAIDDKSTLLNRNNRSFLAANQCFGNQYIISTILERL